MVQNKSFYTWLMTHRRSHSHNSKSDLADLVFQEIDFPKQSHDFDTISRFLEEEASFSFNLGEFDQIWDAYLES